MTVWHHTKQSHELTHHSELNDCCIVFSCTLKVQEVCLLLLSRGVHNKISSFCLFCFVGKIDSPFCLQNCLFLLATHYAHILLANFVKAYWEDLRWRVRNQFLQFVGRLLGGVLPWASSPISGIIILELCWQFQPWAHEFIPMRAITIAQVLLLQRRLTGPELWHRGNIQKEEDTYRSTSTKRWSIPIVRDCPNLPSETWCWRKSPQCSEISLIRNTSGGVLNLDDMVPDTCGPCHNRLPGAFLSNAFTMNHHLTNLSGFAFDSRFQPYSGEVLETRGAVVPHIRSPSVKRDHRSDSRRGHQRITCYHQQRYCAHTAFMNENIRTQLQNTSQELECCGCFSM